MYQGVNGSAKFTRTSSQICPTPEEELLDAVLTNNLDKIEQLVVRNEHLLSHTYEEYEKRILLIACSEEGVGAETVKKLLNLRANPRDYSDEGWEALHWAAQRTDPRILQVLLDRNPGDVNVLDSHGNTPLQILIRYGATNSSNFDDCARLLISKGADVSLTDNKNKNALDWAKKRQVLEKIQDIINNSQGNVNNNFDSTKNPGEELYNYLKQGDESGFISYRNGDIDVDYENGSTLLQFSCEKSLTRAALYLLAKGADFEKTGIKNHTKPIVIAAEQGNHVIFKALLDKYPTLTSIPEGLLPIFFKYSHNEGFEECYHSYRDRILKTENLDERSLKVNEKDRNGNTALKYIIRYGDSKTVHELLDQGASLGAKDPYNSMPIHDIKPELLEEHLDNCIKFDVKSNNTKVENEDFRITLAFRTLIPPYAKLRKESEKDVEAAGITSLVTKELVQETEVISFMANTPEYKHLLSHPVIVSFLLIKWLQIQCLFWANLGFYIAFVMSLVVYIFSDYAYFPTAEKSTIHLLFATLSYACLSLSLVLLAFRELFQICVAPKKYFKNFENYIEIILIVLTSFIVFVGHPTMDTKKQLSSLAILLAAFELVLMLGSHPYFSTNVVMLKTVSFNFFKFLVWYCLLIIAFAMSFYLLFTSSVPNSLGMPQNQTAEEDDDKSFDDPGRSIFKTIIMLTGEFDASSINFDTFPVTSKVIFALFIFMIAIILLNLLNGLAVSDTQMIKNEAELVGHIARAQHIRYVESMFLDNVLPTNILNRIRDLCCCLPLKGSWNVQIAHTFCPSVCLFPEYLNYELVVYPNKNAMISCNHEEKILKQGCLPCSSIHLDRQTVKRINDIVQKKIVEENTADVNSKMEKEISEIKSRIDQILIALNK